MASIQGLPQPCVPLPPPLSQVGFLSARLRSPPIRRGGGGVARWVGTFMVARVQFPLRPSHLIRMKPLPRLIHKEPILERSPTRLTNHTPHYQPPTGCDKITVVD